MGVKLPLRLAQLSLVPKLPLGNGNVGPSSAWAQIMPKER